VEAAVAIMRSVRDGRISVLWLCGPPGAGKSSVGMALYAGLARSGARAGFADADQLGMCFPAPLDDPQRYRMKAVNLAALAGNFRAAGCDALIAAGDLGTSSGLSPAALPRASLAVCRLRVSPGEQRQRLISRGAAADLIADAPRLAGELDRTSFADACIDTDGRTVAEVVRLVRERCDGWPPEHAAGDGAGEGGPASSPAVGADGDALLVCGATGVGKSEAAFAVFVRQLQAGAAAAYLDLDQLAFLSQPPAGDPGSHQFKAGNLAAIWRTYHAMGARRLVLSGPVPDKRAAAVYADALPAARITLCRLHADPAALAHRISLRGQGRGSWPQPGDPLIGLPDDQLRLVAAASAAEAAALERSGLGDLRIDTSARTSAEVTDLIVRHW
jgi:hypothetical protein